MSDTPQDVTAKVLDLANKSNENATQALEQAKAAGAEAQKAAAAVEEARQSVERVEASVGEKVKELRTLLEHEHGKSGAQDWYNMAAKWLAGSYYHAKYGQVPEQFKIEGYEFGRSVTKAVANFDTTTGATAG